MDEAKTKTRSIWFFVGIVLSAMGFITFLAGILSVDGPENQTVRLATLHANIWWGILMFLAGLLYAAVNRNKFIDQ